MSSEQVDFKVDSMKEAICQISSDMFKMHSDEIVTKITRSYFFNANTLLNKIVCDLNSLSE